jgi:hypothetical protein
MSYSASGEYQDECASIVSDTATPRPAALTLQRHGVRHRSRDALFYLIDSAAAID